ncbi:MAG TPA: DUF1343 domain-containing protein [Thermoanaerobaculia bacterium]|nr:DUF1343 domain-containing protein [Thermoanaerobaculia bacterium]
MIATGLDRLLEEPERLAGRRFGLLAHAASVTRSLVPAHLALGSAGHPPQRLFGPEHGYYGVEQDMVGSADQVDPWTGAPIVSLYGEDAASLRPRVEAFEGLDLLLIDVQDVGARYYTYAATAVWAAEVALGAGLEVWLLDRPNPLGGEIVEGNLPQPGFESFVGAFRLPIRHGLTVGEIAQLEAARGAWGERLTVLSMRGWRRAALWPELGRAWIAPSPNMPDFQTALVYPGLCLVEATAMSEGRGTTRPFRLIGAPGLDPLAFACSLRSLDALGVRAVPTYFRPWHQKHRGEVCGGVELVVVEPGRVAAARLGVEVLAALRSTAGEGFAWREDPYEFVADRPAIDLLAGSESLRLALDGDRGLEDWVASWHEDEEEFRRERRDILIYREGGA